MGTPVPPNLTALKSRRQTACASGDYAVIGTPCRVTSTDYVPALLKRGAERARAERLDAKFEAADAEALESDLTELLNRGGVASLVVPSEYLEIVVATALMG